MLNKISWFVICLLFPFLLEAQRITDTIKNKAYTCYYSTEIKAPIYTTHILLKSGGELSRKYLRFKNTLNLLTATHKDYAKSGYDIGHLVSCEDYAYNKILQSKTFEFCNAFPQTPELNRGLWKTLENRTRLLNKRYLLIVITGGFYDSCFVLKNNVYRPEECWKVIINKNTREVMFCFSFTNTSTPVQRVCSIEEIENRLHIKLLY